MCERLARRDAPVRRRPGVPGGTISAATRSGRSAMYSILYIIGAIVVIIVVLRLLGLY